MTESSLPRSPTSGPLALVGIGCRLPANISNVDDLWSFLLAGGDAIRPVPPDRWSLDRFYDPSPQRAAKTYAREAGYLETLPLDFDAEAFGLSPREAAHLDPQQRLLLETTWEALENAGQSIDQLRGSATGVFMGGFTLDMMITLLSPHNRELISNHTATAATMAMFANRVSHVFDLQGPSITCDTACSSSLTAFHLACQALWRGECERALVGGANVMLRPEFPMAMSKGRFLALDGRCKTFSAQADGYGRGEGAAVVLLKPLVQALNDGDRIYATVRGTGINQDGATPGITLPRRESQEALIREVMARHDIDPAEIRYVEAHGTGTQAGDTTEAEALANVIGKSRPPTQPLIVGSVKTNFGHLEAASGILGIIKAALCLHHRTVPRHLHCDEPNPDIPFADWGLQVPTTGTTLPAAPAPCLAAINSFGYGGSNAHVVLGAVAPTKPSPRPVAAAPAAPPSAWRLYPFSAHSPNALAAVAGTLGRWLDSAPADLALDRLAHTLSDRRTHHHHRGAIIAAHRTDLTAALLAHAHGENLPGIISGQVAPMETPHPVFVFTGMGPQWWAMGQELYREEPVFRASLERIDALFRALAGWSILAVMLAPEAESRITATVNAQPANFALQVALADLWASWGITPAAIIGHSVGEIAAVAVAGALSLPDAVKVVYHRSQLQQSLEGQGRMLATNLPPAAAAEVADGLPDLVSVAAINSPTSTVLSGDPIALEELATGLAAEGHDARFLRVEVAYHSHQMEPLDADLHAALRDLRPQTPAVPLYSTVTGEIVEAPQHDADYWWRNLRQPVLFHAAAEAVIAAGHHTFLEIGPHPVLGGSLREILAARSVEGSCHFSLKRQTPEALTVRTALAELHTRGISVDWASVNQTTHASPLDLDLPNYPWQRERLWIESEASRLDRVGSPGLALLGERTFRAGYQRELRLAPHRLPWMDDHQVEGASVFPAAGYVDAMFSNARELRPDQTSYTLEAVAFHHLLVLAEEEDSLLQLDYDDTQHTFRLEGARASQTHTWQLHATARLVQGELSSPPTAQDLAALRAAFATTLDPAQVYADLASRQLAYGPSFRRLREVRPGPRGALARLDVRPRDEDHLVHPALLDGAFQAMIGALEPNHTATVMAFVPVGVDRITLFQAPTDECWVHVELTASSADTLRGDVHLYDASGTLLLQLQGVHCQALAPTQSDTAAPASYREVWEAWTPPTTSPAATTVALIGTGITADQLAAEIAQRETRVDTIPAWSALPLNPAPAVIIDATALDTPFPPNAAPLAQRYHDCGQGLTAVAALPTPSRVILLTRGAQHIDTATAAAPDPAGLWGVARVARLEYPQLPLGLIDLDADPASLAAAGQLACASGELAEPELSIRQGQVCVRRLRELPPPPPPSPEPAQPASCARLVQTEPGLMTSLQLQATTRTPLADHEVEVRVHRAALNFKDVLKVLGTIDRRALTGTFFEDTLGMEYVGEIVTTGRSVTAFKVGDRVFGCARGGCMRTHLRLDPARDLVFPETTPTPVPQFVAAVTVWHGLKEIGRLRAGERVLIHSATGAVGLYAVAYAQSVGAEIFATAGSEEKRAYLRSLGVAHVYDSRSLGFAAKIRAATAGHGVDVVLNSLAGELLHQTLALVAPYGRFIEIGKQDIMADHGLPLGAFNRNLTFAAIDVDRLLMERRDEFIRMLHEANRARADGILRDPPVEVFPAREAVAAFQRLAQAKHLGKVAIDFDLTGAELYPSHPGAPIRSDATYLVTGGLGGFGAATARWLATQGAGRCVLVGRRGEHTPGATDLREELEALGTAVEIAALDVADDFAIGQLIARLAAASPPLRGVFHAAGVLVDRPLADLTSSDYATVLAPKVAGAFALDRATRTVPLDHFVLFSSITAVSGNSGQANYAAANAVLDAVAATRRAQGLAGCSINWGAIARVGMAARDPQVLRHLQGLGLTAIEPQAALDQWRAQSLAAPAHWTIAEIDWGQWATHHPSHATHALLQHVRRDPSAAKARGTSLPAEFDQLPSAARLALVEGVVREETARVLKTAPDRLESHRTLHQAGLDSLMEIELRIALGKALGVEMSRMDFARAATLDGLTAEFARRLDLSRSSDPTELDLDQIAGADLDQLLAALESEPQPSA